MNQKQRSIKQMARYMAEYTEFTLDKPRFAKLARRFREKALLRLFSTLDIDMNGLPIL